MHEIIESVENFRTKGSKIKYDQAHPTVSVRVTQQLYDKLKDLREHSGKRG